MTIYSTDPGKYRHRVTIQERGNIRQPNGGYAPGWVDKWVNVPAEVLSGGGSEPVLADAKQSKELARVNVSWLPELSDQMRLVFGGKQWDIVAIDYDSTGRREARFRVQAGLTDGR